MDTLERQPSPAPAEPSAPLPFQRNDGGDRPPGRLRRLLGDGDFLRRLPTRGLLLAALVVLAVWQGGRFVKSSFRSIPAGQAGIALNKFTGAARMLAPGTHFLPSVMYDLSSFRVSDQLLPEKDARFVVASKDGISIELQVQARWALDRGQLPARWAGLPPDPAREVVGPTLASLFRSYATEYEATALRAEKREELASRAAEGARKRLLEAGIVLKDVYVGGLRLPPEFERGRLALLEETQATDRKIATLKLKQQEIEQTKLEAEAVKVRAEKQSETEAAQRLIVAKGEADAMQFILPLREKEIQQEKLRAEAEKQRRLKQAEGEAEAGKIQTEAEAQRRKTLADAEAYAIRATSLAQFENLKREAELIQANPIWVSKIFAEKISDKVQVILTPQLSSNVYTDQVMKNLANGKPAVAARSTQAANAPGASPAAAPEADSEASGAR